MKQKSKRKREISKGKRQGHRERGKGKQEKGRRKGEGERGKGKNQNRQNYRMNILALNKLKSQKHTDYFFINHP